MHVRKKGSVTCISSFVYSSVEASRRPKDALLRANTTQQWVGRGICGIAVPNENPSRQIGSLILTGGRALRSVVLAATLQNALFVSWKRAQVGSGQAQWAYADQGSILDRICHGSDCNKPLHACTHPHNNNFWMCPNFSTLSSGSS